MTSSSSGTTTGTPGAPRSCASTASPSATSLRTALVGRGRAPYSIGDLAVDADRAARPPRHQAGPRRRRLDGRHDRPDPGDRPPRPGAVPDVDHVHHRSPHRRPDPPEAHPAAARLGRQHPRLLRRSVPSGRPRRSPRPATRPTREASLARAHETYDRGWSASGVGPAHAGGAHPARPHEAAVRDRRAGHRHPRPRTTRWSTGPADGPRHAPSRAPSTWRSRAWVTTCRRSSTTPSSTRSPRRPRARQVD